MFTCPEEDLEIVMAKDVRTILKHLNLNPEFTTYICCPKCYALYLLETEQTRCLYRTTSQAAVCDHDLLKTRVLCPRGILPWVQQRTVYQPHARYNRVFVTQDFQEWLSWFLSLPDIEKSIEDWTDQVRNNQSDSVFDYQQSLAWKKINPDKVEPHARGSFLKLTFSLFVDWFNPFGNKLAGRQASFGVLAYVPRYASSPLPSNPPLVSCWDHTRPKRTRHDNHVKYSQAPG